MAFYPSVRYHRDGETTALVKDEAEAAALPADEWADSPAVWEQASKPDVGLDWDAADQPKKRKAKAPKE